MAGNLKDMGLKELAALKKRVLRQHALGRINAGDRANLVAKIDDIEAYIIKMPEGKATRFKDFY
ncbi:hypothetical protein GJ25_gp063 [Mycobacterium phage Hawkeye]|uniref:Uncharacterized protein n=1 Tax=Mycobacterium phage Hawkeye TaxID=1458711 RepID=X2KYW5_9CAUD|nr:hypothetical protein GJ25_gp063 [Mycobacterium phage Hawkeye]AHN84074.1 hypothetical protein PBI_HAWKEYE_63 [Mycobacterium phage Hawkeye]